MEEEENTDVGDFSSSLEGYPGSKGKTGKDEADESNDKNTGSDNVADTIQSTVEVGQKGGENDQRATIVASGVSSNWPLFWWWSW